MVRETWTYSTDSNFSETGFDGFTGVANYLNKEFGTQITRQGVYLWYRRRATTMFPEKQSVAPGGRQMKLFNLQDVRAWYVVHRAGVPEAAAA